VQPETFFVRTEWTCRG